MIKSGLDDYAVEGSDGSANLPEASIHLKIPILAMHLTCTECNSNIQIASSTSSYLMLTKKFRRAICQPTLFSDYLFEHLSGICAHEKFLFCNI